VQVVVIKAKLGTIYIELPSELYQSVIYDGKKSRLKVWAPILRKIAMTYLEDDRTPLTGVHLSFLYLYRVFNDASG
jgi:hypothetical protein